MSHSELMYLFLESLKKLYSLLGLTSMRSLGFKVKVVKTEPRLYLETKLQTMEEGGGECTPEP